MRPQKGNGKKIRNKAMQAVLQGNSPVAGLQEVQLR